MNCNSVLLKHLLRVHRKKAGAHACLWKNCGVMCAVGDNHFVRHAFAELQCPYQGCSNSFGELEALAQHALNHDRNGDPLKPSCEPQALLPIENLPPCPDGFWIPERDVYPSAMTASRRERLTPWTRKRIAGLYKPTHDKSRRLRVAPKDGNNPDEEPVFRYEFLTDHPHRYSPHISIPVDERFAPIARDERRDWGFAPGLAASEQVSVASGSGGGSSSEHVSSGSSGGSGENAQSGRADDSREFSVDPLLLQAHVPQQDDEENTEDEADVAMLLAE